MKRVVLTIDYELFLGNEPGTVEDCMIEPTEKLSSILEKNNSSMTVFWDILHYYRLKELEKSYNELKQDRTLIENQILDLAQKGHDIQLHLHPHWFDAAYVNGKWEFSYGRFKLHNLSVENNREDINTITGCITISKNLIEDLIRRVNPDYKVTSFRAGGYLIEPFGKIRDALLKNEIRVDSSVCPGLQNNSEVSPYDFIDYPAKTKYNFDLTPQKIVEYGNFFEVPITTIKLSGIRSIYFKILRKIKYSSLENERKGSGVGEIRKIKKKSEIERIINTIINSTLTQFTTDSSFKEKFDYLYKKSPEYATMILHPKLLNRHTLKILDDYVTTNKIRFISIRDYINDEISLK